MASIPGIPRPPFGGVRGLMRPLAVPLSGLTAYRQRIETIASNIANIDTLDAGNGEPYRRQIAVMGQRLNGGVQVSGVQEDQTDFLMEYDPGNPAANELGYVLRPNVDMHVEIADMMISQRMFEANATVFEATKAMLRRALDI